MTWILWDIGNSFCFHLRLCHISPRFAHISTHLHFDPMVLQLHDMPVQEKHRISYKMLQIPWDRDPVVSSRDSGVFSKSSNFEGQKSDGPVFFWLGEKHKEEKNKLSTFNLQLSLFFSLQPHSFVGQQIFCDAFAGKRTLAASRVPQLFIHTIHTHVFHEQT